MRCYLVIGAAGHAQEVAWTLRAQIDAGMQSKGELVFFDDRIAPGPVASGLGLVVGTLDDVASHAGDDARLVLGIGLPRVKAAVTARLAHLGLPWTTVVHPTALVGPNSTIGDGSYLAAGAIVTVNVRIGRFVTLNMRCQAAHEDVVGDLVTLHPGVQLSGDVVVGEGCELGSGAIAIPGVRIGTWAVLGAGCVAVRSLDGGRTWVGVPARALAVQGESRAVGGGRR